MTVIIPTRADDDGTAGRCLESIRPQLAPGDSVIVSVDGHPASDAFADCADARVCTGPRGGPGTARNRAIEHAHAPVVLFLNDDVIAEPGLLEAHRRFHANRARASEPPAMMLGSAPWRIDPDDRVLDRMLRETSMIFFYDTMSESQPDHDWGCRHAWTLNLSLPRSACLFFSPTLNEPMFDDVEWAWRVSRSFGCPVLYRPEACVTHEHRYEPHQLLRREGLLGHQALAFRQSNPECAAEVLGDRLDPEIPPSVPDTEEIEQARVAFAGFAGTGVMPADSVSPDQLHASYKACSAWRMAARTIGFLAALEGHDARHAQSRVAELLTREPVV